MRRTFGTTEDSVGKARRYVSRLISDLPDDIRDSVTLMVSELATNALVHASSGFNVDIARSDEAVTISVTDRGDGTPAIQSPSSSEPHGRGLRIVEALSDEWGTSSSAKEGKTVWFQMSLRAAGSDPGRNVNAELGVGPKGGGDRTGDSLPGPISRPLPGGGLPDRPRARHRIRRVCLRRVLLDGWVPGPTITRAIRSWSDRQTTRTTPVGGRMNPARRVIDHHDEPCRPSPDAPSPPHARLHR